MSIGCTKNGKPCVFQEVCIHTNISEFIIKGITSKQKPYCIISFFKKNFFTVIGVMESEIEKN